MNVTQQLLEVKSMENSFDPAHISLAKISHTKQRSGADDPTKSGLSKSVPSNGLYYKPHVETGGFVSLRGYRKSVLLDSREGNLPIGKRKGNWVYFDNERQRVDCQAFQSRFGTVFFESGVSKAEKIKSELAKIGSPFDLSQKDSEYLGLFFDGTSNFRGQSGTNVYELYNVYLGNKIYYGGVGNSIENNFSGFMQEVIAGLESAFAYGFDFNMERAMTDINEFLSKTNRPTKIQLFGFSRGAAQANKLAKVLKNTGIEVNLLLMIDPVYSIGLPGQGSQDVYTSPFGQAHNYVETEISNNVRKAVILYAEHETRVWFPATKFMFDKKNTQLIAGLTPGNHCDAGGFWNRNGAFQYISLYWILEKIVSGLPGDPFSQELTCSYWQNAIGVRLKEITDNPQSMWNWSNIDEFYILERNLLSYPKQGIQKIAKAYLGPTFGELLGEKVGNHLFGNQQNVSEIDRRFNALGYTPEKLRDWLQGKDALPVADYDYASKPPLVAEVMQA